MNPFEAPATFFSLFTFIIISVVGTFLWFVRGVRADQDRILQTLDNHLGSVARSLTLVEERLSRIDNKMLDALIVPLQSQGVRTHITMEKTPTPERVSSEDKA